MHAARIKTNLGRERGMGEKEGEEVKEGEREIEREREREVKGTGSKGKHTNR